MAKKGAEKGSSQGRRAKGQRKKTIPIEQVAEASAVLEAAVARKVVQAPEAGATDPTSSSTSSTSRTSTFQRMPHGNALGVLIERQFATAVSPCRSYSDLERRSGISREALSRYVTTRADRRRAPTIDTLVAIADALHLSLEAVCRAAAATAKGVALPTETIQRSREEALESLAQSLSDSQFSAVVELLRQMQPAK